MLQSHTSRRALYLVLLPALFLSMVAGIVPPVMTLVLGNFFNIFESVCHIYRAW